MMLTDTAVVSVNIDHVHTHAYTGWQDDEGVEMDRLRMLAKAHAEV